MLRNPVRLLIDGKLSTIFKEKNHFYTTSSVISSEKTEKWDLLAAVCLERKPVITIPLKEIEKNMLTLLADIEYERSLKSDHEMKHEMELHKLELLKKGQFDADIDKSLKNTAQDFADACVEELSKFKTASTITKDDTTNNVKSLNRKLDKHLVLVVEQKPADTNKFLCPQGLRQDGETLRQAAERVLNEYCGPNLKAQFYGNAPTGFYKYKYPKKVQNETGIMGAKVFFYIAKHLSGQLSKEGTDFKWLDRTELSKELPEKYHGRVTQFLIDEC